MQSNDPVTSLIATLGWLLWPLGWGRWLQPKVFLKCACIPWLSFWVLGLETEDCVFAQMGLSSGKGVPVMLLTMCFAGVRKNTCPYPWAWFWPWSLCRYKGLYPKALGQWNETFWVLSRPVFHTSRSYAKTRWFQILLIMSQSYFECSQKLKLLQIRATIYLGKSIHAVCLKGNHCEVNACNRSFRDSLTCHQPSPEFCPQMQGHDLTFAFKRSPHISQLYQLWDWLLCKPWWKCTWLYYVSCHTPGQPRWNKKWMWDPTQL